MQGGAGERCCVLFQGSVVETSRVSSAEELQASGAKKWGPGGVTVPDPGDIGGVRWAGGRWRREQCAGEHPRARLDAGVPPSSSVLRAVDKHVYTAVHESRIWPRASSSCGDARGGQKQSVLKANEDALEND